MREEVLILSKFRLFPVGKICNELHRIVQKVKICYIIKEMK